MRRPVLLSTVFFFTEAPSAAPFAAFPTAADSLSFMLERARKIPVKSAAEIAAVRAACRAAATVLQKMAEAVAPGVNTYDLDQLAKKWIAEEGAESACFNYRAGGLRPYPCHTCISVNEEVVHGIGKLERVLAEGDVVSLDVVVRKDGFIGDNARTVAVGTIAPEVEGLLTTTREALFAAIEKARPGNRVGDLSAAVQKMCERAGYGIVREFVGHGVGRSMHEPPQIPNYGRRKDGPRLAPGMTLAIEPMVNLGRPEIAMLDDGWTAVAADGLPSAHFEHTVLVTESDPEILTILKN